MLKRLIKCNIVLFILMFLLFAFTTGEFNMLNWSIQTRTGFSIVEGLLFFISFLIWIDD